VSPDTGGNGKLASLRQPLVFDPGDRWEYGINIDWVGRAIEAVGGEPSQIRAVLSTDAVTTRSPLASNVAARTGPSWCSGWPIGSPVRASQIRAVLSSDAVTTRSPLASNVAAQTGPSWCSGWPIGSLLSDGSEQDPHSCGDPHGQRTPEHDPYYARHDTCAARARRQRS
jgi:hypothetical protein